MSAYRSILLGAVIAVVIAVAGAALGAMLASKTVTSTVTTWYPPSTTTVTVTAGGGATSTVYKTVYRTVYETVTAPAATETVTVVAGGGGGAQGAPAVGSLKAWSYVVELARNVSISRGPIYVTVATVTPATMATVTPQSAPIVVLGKAPAYSATNVQVAGVDEPDIVKLNGTHIAVAVWGNVEVYKAYPPSQLSLKARIRVGDVVESLAGKEFLALVSDNKTIEVISPVKRSVSVRGLYYVDDRLVVIATEYRWPGPLEPRTWILVFGEGMKLVKHAVVPGSFYDARLVNSTLVVVTRAGRPTVPPIIILGSRTAIVPQPVLTGPPTSETVVAAFNLESWRADSIALVGPWGPEAVYMAANGELYVAAWSAPVRIEKPSAAASEAVKRLILRPQHETTIVKLAVTPEPRIKIEGSTTIPGLVRKQWMLDVYNGTLRVVVEDWRDGRLIVSLYTFDTRTMKMLGSLENITVNERVHAVRFLGPLLYLVTYRSVDPLFAINLSDPRHPRVIGFVKSPGFDEYLHPVNTTLLLGVGVENSTVRVTLYRIHGDGSVSILSRVYIKGYSWSPVLQWYLHGHRAFVFNPGRLEAYIPVQGWRKGVGGIAGVAVVAVRGEALRLRGVVEHRWAVRAAYIDGYLYSIAPGNPLERIRVYSLETLEHIASAPKPLAVSVAEILANPEKYSGETVVVTGRAVKPSADMGPPPVSRSDWALDDGTGRIYVSAYWYGGGGRAPPPGSLVRVAAVVRLSFDGRPYLIPVSVEALRG